MRRFACALIACLWAPVATGQTTSLVALTEDYHALGWEAVGRLDLGGAFCTGTLISTTQVLTAAHCLFDDRGTPRAAQKITFRAGLRRGKARASRQIARMVAHPGYDPRKGFGVENVNHDLALLELAQPIQVTEANPFSLHSEKATLGTVSVVSYGRGRANHPSRQDACALEHKFENILLFDCEVTFGSSGAPVFSHQDGRAQIVSVISGMSEARGKRISMGPNLPPLISALRRALYTQPSYGPGARRVQATAQKPGATPRVRRLGGAQPIGHKPKFVAARIGS